MDELSKQTLMKETCGKRQFPSLFSTEHNIRQTPLINKLNTWSELTETIQTSTPTAKQKTAMPPSTPREKNNVTNNWIIKFPYLIAPWRFLNVFTRVRHHSGLHSEPDESCPPSYFHKSFFNIIFLTSTLLSGLLLWGLLTKILFAFL